jgi:hypothetical protein
VRGIAQRTPLSYLIFSYLRHKQAPPMPRPKTILLWFVLLLLSYHPGTAQQYDKVWAIGTPVATLAFNVDSVVLGQLPDSTTLSFETLGSMCDSNGNFLFYSNGLAIYNRYGNIMPNGDSLSFPSEYYSQVEPQGMPSRQGVIILPKPNDANQYYIFHYTPTDTLLNIGGYEAFDLYYSIVDMSLDSGRGDLTAKNIPIIQNELLSASRIAACRHANGRDWWIVKPAWHENIYYSFLLTPDGLWGPYTQQIGPLYEAVNEIPAYSCFSPDGSKYASVTQESYVVLMDFDRCTGLFSHPDSFYNNDSYNPATNPITGGLSLAFSSSGRFLYVDIPPELNQYDLWSPQIHDSIRIETDTGEFYQMNILQLAPNGKIYISCFNGGSYAMHVINQPDSLGLACDFQLFGQPTSTQSPVALPYFPNYRLGALIGSGCDTINGIPTPALTSGEGASVSPNPASSIFTIAFSNPNDIEAYKDLHFTLYDLTGRLVMDETLREQSTVLHRRDQMDGMYLWHISDGDKNLYNGKLVLR